MQKTAYEMRISDWSSDVCSSDLAVAGVGHTRRMARLALDPWHDQAAHYQRDHKDAGVVEHLLDVLDRQRAYDGRGQKCNDQITRKQDFLAIIAQRSRDQLEQAVAKHPHDRRDGTQLDDYFENLVTDRGEPEPVADQQQITLAQTRRAT